jgi:AraC-like DNA-binding protein
MSAESTRHRRRAVKRFEGAVRVATFLPPHQAARIRAVLSPADRIWMAESWQTLEALIRREPISVVVLDPAADGMMEAAVACRLIRDYASIPFVAYVPLDAPFARAITHMANNGLHDVLIVRCTDSPETIQETLERAGLVRELAELVVALQPWLEQIPSQLRNVLITALHHPDRFVSAKDIAASAGVTVSALYRSFRNAGLASPRHFVVGARAFRGYLYLRDSGFSIRDVASKLGYTHPRIFAHQMELVFRMRPSALRHVSDVEQPMREVVRCLSRADAHRPASQGTLTRTR